MALTRGARDRARVAGAATCAGSQTGNGIRAKSVKLSRIAATSGSLVMWR
jgi:hypothetical protein